MSEMTKSRSILRLRLGCHEKGENRTEWDFEFWCKLDGLSDLHYTACSRIVPETLEMENENRWKRLDKHLLAHIAQDGWAVLHKLRLGDAHEGVLNGEDRIRLQKVSHNQQETHAEEKGGDTDLDVEME